MSTPALLLICFAVVFAIGFFDRAKPKHHGWEASPASEPEDLQASARILNVEKGGDS